MTKHINRYKLLADELEKARKEAVALNCNIEMLPSHAEELVEALSCVYTAIQNLNKLNKWKSVE